MPALNAVLEDRLIARDSARLRRLTSADALAEGMLHTAQGRLHHFCGNDYLGLAHDARVVSAAREAMLQGTGAGASRLVTGNHSGYDPLERALAAHSGHEAALVFSSGFAAITGTISALMGKGDLILADRLAHACMLDGAKLSGAKLLRFHHNDRTHLEALLAQHRAQYQHTLIITEHIFSMDGDKAPLDDLVSIKNKYDAWLMVDDAHGIGIVNYPHKSSVDIWCGTLSKALASVGGYVCASALLKSYLVNHARSLIYSTALPPSALAAAQAAIAIMVQESWRGERALAHARRVTQALSLPHADSAIVPVVIGNDDDALRMSERLKHAGYAISAIRPPTVPEGTARLRLSFSAAHSDAQVDGLITALSRELGR